MKKEMISEEQFVEFYDMHAKEEVRDGVMSQAVAEHLRFRIFHHPLFQAISCNFPIEAMDKRDQLIGFHFVHDDLDAVELQRMLTQTDTYAFVQMDLVTIHGTKWRIFFRQCDYVDYDGVDTNVNRSGTRDGWFTIEPVA